MSDNFIEIAWAAGFLDGEGSFGSYKQTNCSTLRYRIQCTQVEREPLDRLASLLGGTVRGPYGPYAGNRRSYFQWILESRQAREATELLSPYLCAPKREQAKVAMEVGK